MFYILIPKQLQKSKQYSSTI